MDLEMACKNENFVYGNSGVEFEGHNGSGLNGPNNNFNNLMNFSRGDMYGAEGMAGASSDNEMQGNGMGSKMNNFPEIILMNYKKLKQSHDELEKGFSFIMEQNNIIVNNYKSLCRELMEIG
jgi:hypothetical protein